MFSWFSLKDDDEDLSDTETFGETAAKKESGSPASTKQTYSGQKHTSKPAKAVVGTTWTPKRVLPAPIQLIQVS